MNAETETETETETVDDADDPRGDLGPWWEQHGDRWRALIAGHYPTTVAPAAGGFVVILDGELLDGPDEARPFVFVSAYDAATAAERLIQDRFQGLDGGPHKRRYPGVYGNGCDLSDHEAVAEKWLRALARS